MKSKTVFPENFKPVHIRNATTDDRFEPSQTGESLDGNVDGKKVAELFIVGHIGDWWGVQGADVYYALTQEKFDLINVYVSSSGGDVVAGFQIHDLLKGHPAPVDVYYFSLGASAATFMSGAARKVYMSKQAMLMIHEGASGLYGYYQKDELEKIASMTGKFNNRIVDLYNRTTGMERGVIEEMMKAETWFEPDEAVQAGFVDEVLDHVKVPFENANMPYDMFIGMYYEHTANFMKNTMAAKGFTRMAANALISLKKGQKGHSEISNKTDMFEKLFPGLFAKMNWKVQNDKGETVNEKEIGEAIKNEIESNPDAKDLIGTEMKDQLKNLVSAFVAEQIKEGGVNVNADETVETMKALTKTVKDMAAEIAELKELKPQVENSKKELETKDSEMKKILNDIQGIKIGKSGGTPTNDKSHLNLDKSGDDDKGGDDKKIKAFSEGSTLWNTMVGGGVISASDIQAIEAEVRNKKAKSN